MGKRYYDNYDYEEAYKGHLGHADTYHIAKAVEYELLFYEWERLEATA